MQSNLGNALRARFERTGNVADLDAAIDAGQQAVAAAMAEHPNRPGFLSNLGIALRHPLRASGDAPIWTPRSTPATSGQRLPRPIILALPSVCRTWG